MANTTFQDLVQIVKDASTEYQQYKSDCVSFCDKFVRAFRDYVGATDDQIKRTNYNTAIHGMRMSGGGTCIDTNRWVHAQLALAIYPARSHDVPFSVHKTDVGYDVRCLNVEAFVSDDASFDSCFAKLMPALKSDLQTFPWLYQ